MSAATMIKPARDAGGTAGAAWDPVSSCEDGPEAALQAERLDQPNRWRRPRRVFVAADLFGPGVSDEYIARVWQVMASCPRHTFLILTGQPGRMRDWLNRCGRWDGFITHNGEPVSSSGGGGLIVGYPDAPPQRPGWDRGPRGGKPRSQPTPIAWGWPLPNVWLGVRAPDQDRADIGIPALLGVPAAVRFLFCDPLTGPLCLEMCDWTPPGMEGFPGTRNPLTGEWWPAADAVAEEHENRITGLPRIDWVIVGGEPGPKARPLPGPGRSGISATTLMCHFSSDSGENGRPRTLRRGRLVMTGETLNVTAGSTPTAEAPGRSPSSPVATTGAGR